MGKKTKIDWADATWNPVTGCLHGCEYCYARKIANRFKGFDVPGGMNGDTDTDWIQTINALKLMQIRDRRLIYQYSCDTPFKKMVFGKTGWLSKTITAPYPFGFEPTFHRYKLDEPEKWKKPRNIFVCSMGDLFGAWIADEWIQEVLQACEAAPQHRYLFLTKNPDRYVHLADLLPYKRRPPYVAEMWFGRSYTGICNYRHIYTSAARRTFISIEPLLHSISENDAITIAAFNDWIIIGAETGNRKGKVIPKKEWIQEIVDICLQEGTPVFMKESLRDLMGDDFRQEFPWEV